MEESKKAKLKALKILTQTDKTEQELRASLARSGFSAEAVQDALDYVRSFGYLDDARYAKRYVECCCNRKSRMRIRYDLIRRGVDKELVEEAIAGCEDMDETEVLRRCLYKKWNCDEKPDEKNLNRIVGALTRQGFSNHDIWKVLREENLT